MVILHEEDPLRPPRRAGHERGQRGADLLPRLLRVRAPRIRVRPLRFGGQVVVRFLDDSWIRELIAVTRDRADEARLAWIVAERPSQGAHGLRQRAVRDDDVAPDAIENLAA